MVEREVVVGFEEGIHGRPASDLVKTAKRFRSQVKVVKGDREANAKSPMQVTGFAKKGAKIILRVEGDDEEEAASALSNLISN